MAAGGASLARLLNPSSVCFPACALYPPGGARPGSTAFNDGGGGGGGTVEERLQVAGDLGGLVLYERA